MGRKTGLRLCALLFLAFTSTVQADELRIRRAESIDLRAPQVAAKPDASGYHRVVFHAEGRQFDLELQSNERILRRLSPAQKASLGDVDVYRGRLAGRDDTWVRLTRFGSELHGAFWDGRELYTIAPASALRGALPAQFAASDGHVLYRLSDTESSLDTGVCGLGPRQALGGAAQYGALVRELRARVAAAAIAADQIEIEFIADSDFTSELPINPQFEMLMRVNMVDGIFSDQVGVTIVPSFRLFTDADDPFTSNEAETLLDQLGTYRESTPAVRDRGLAHLLTGRSLQIGGNPNILGIAFLGSLCEPFGGVGISEGADGPTVAALVMAHEIGHNFGAPHDAEPDSPCAGAPPGFLMEPTLNMSNRFSQCSLDQMRPQIAAAACVVPAQYADVTVAVPAPIRALINQPFDYVIEVRSQGNRAATAASVEIRPVGGLTVHSSTAEGGSCAAGPPGALTCTLGDMPAGTTRRVQLSMTVTIGPGTFNTFATARASNDRIATNDTVTVPVFIGSAADVSVTVTPPSIGSPTRQVHTYVATITSHGPLAATGVGMGFHGSSKMRPETASTPGGTCIVDFATAGCTIGTLAPGESRQVEFTARGVLAGSFNARFEAQADNDEIPTNDVAVSAMTLTAVSDLALSPGGSTSLVAGQSSPLQISLASVGQEAVTDVQVRVMPRAQGMVVESASAPGGTCVPSGPQVHCTFTSLPAGSTRLLDASIRGDEVTNGSVEVQIFSAANDEDPANNRSTTLVRVRHLADASVSADPFNSAELQPFNMRVPVRSSGLNAASDLTVTADLPASFTIISAALAGGSCTIVNQRVTCTLASLASDAIAFLDVMLQGAGSGNFTGTVVVDATNDTNPLNDSAQLRLNILPFFDAALDAPASVSGLLNTAVEIPFTITTLNQPMSQVVVAIDQIVGVVVDSATSPAGACTVTTSGNASFVSCAVGSVPARSSTTVLLRLRSAVNGNRFSLRAQMSAQQDSNGSNNSRQVAVHIDGPPDAGFDPGPIEVFSNVNTAFTANLDVSVFGLEGLGNLVVTIPLPAFITASQASADGGGSCVIAAGQVTCSFAQPPGGGFVRHMQLELRGTSTGRFPTTMTLVASNDANPTNNSISVIYVISNPAPPPPPPNQEGGGGGGSLGLVALLGLLLAGFVAVSRRFPA